MNIEQDKESRLVIEKLARGESVEWQWIVDDSPWCEPSIPTLKLACQMYGQGDKLRLKPPAKSIYEQAVLEGKTVQWLDHNSDSWVDLKEGVETIKRFVKYNNILRIKPRILEPDNQPKKTMTAKEYLKKQHGDQYENKEYHWTGLESAWIAGYEEAMGVDPFSPWREKQKRGEKFEYRCFTHLTNDRWVDGKHCAFCEDSEYEFRDYVPYREWKEKFDKGIKLQYRRPWMKKGEWFNVMYWCNWENIKDVEFREVPVKDKRTYGCSDCATTMTVGEEHDYPIKGSGILLLCGKCFNKRKPIHYQCSECGVSITENYKHDYPVTGGVRFKCDKCFYKKEPSPLGPEDVMPGQIIRVKNAAWAGIGIILLVKESGITTSYREGSWKELAETCERLVNNEWLPCAK